ncbi:MAG: hypothetical protein CMJ18_14670 [Phycisphaeraceae bacterium]|nr:hypothetical protein [Phycisphaeraceae bacterium]
MDSSFTNSLESIESARRPDVDWHRLSTAERIRWIELEGYVVLPDLLPPDRVETLRTELDEMPTTAVDYSEHQRGVRDLQYSDCRNALGVVALPAVTDFLGKLFGDELICTSIAFARSEPGHPGIAIHADAQPYGSKIFGVTASSPCLVRVLYYLDDLTPKRSPFKVIPRSHLSLHADGIPYERYLAHEDEEMVTCPAGSAVVINQKVFHGNYPNYDDQPRRLLAIAYRPAWAGPIAEVEEYDESRLSGVPEDARRYFKSLNTRHINFDVPNRPDDMGRGAAGIAPSRWGNGA